MTVPTDLLGRPLRRLRISVTDRCNMRCRYCMPEDEYVWLPRSSILSFEEIARLTQVFTSVGVSHVRLTGGEPLLRHDLPALVAQLRAIEGVEDLSLTTNATLLAQHARALKAAGLDRITVSLDSLRSERLAEFTKTDPWEAVVAGLDAAADAGFRGTKINTVVIRGFNDDEVGDLLAFARERALQVRFIEYMDVGGATRWNMESVVSRAEILDRLGDRFGPPTPVLGDPTAPADLFALPDGTAFGIIASTTSPFCAACDRSRLTADGTWFTCLYAGEGVNLRDPLRAGAGVAELSDLVRERWERRRDQGAVDRLALPDRRTLYPLESLRADPRREMHTRGG